MYEKDSVMEMCTNPLAMSAENCVKQAVAYIHENYASPITTEQLARKSSLSKYYFIHMFKKLYQETPYHYLTRYRIDRAKCFIKNSSLSLNTISIMSGYDNYSNFLVHFKKFTGTTPTEYRKQLYDS